MLLASDWLGNAPRKMEVEVQTQEKEGIVILEQWLLPLNEEVRESNYAWSDQPNFWEELEFRYLTSKLCVTSGFKEKPESRHWELNPLGMWVQDSIAADCTGL